MEENTKNTEGVKPASHHKKKGRPIGSTKRDAETKANEAKRDAATKRAINKARNGGGKSAARRVSDEEIENMFQELKTAKYRFIAALMLYCGFRVSEALSLKINDFNWEDGIINVKTLKQKEVREKDKQVVPKKLKEFAEEYWKTLKKEEKKETNYMFPALNNKKDGKYLTRIQILRVFKRACGFSPHCLRHTYGCKMIENGEDVAIVAKMMRHKNFAMSYQFYSGIKEETRRHAIAHFDDKSLFEQVRERIFVAPSRSTMPLSFAGDVRFVGRANEITKVIELSEKSINVLITGEKGVGKSKMLKQITIEKCFRFDDLDGIRKTLLDFLVQLKEGDKEAVAEMLRIDKSKITILSIPNIVKALKSLTGEKEYTIIIDKIDNLTETGRKVIDNLRYHFHLIIACQQLDIKYASTFSNFERIELNNLSQSETFNMIEKNCTDFRSRIKDFPAFRVHVWNKSNGNPMLILDLLDRARAERVVTLDSISTLVPQAALNRDFDVSPLLLLLIVFATLYKFYIREESPLDKEGAMMLGGALSVIAVVGRFALMSIKQKWI